MNVLHLLSIRKRRYFGYDNIVENSNMSDSHKGLIKLKNDFDGNDTRKKIDKKTSETMTLTDSLLKSLKLDLTVMKYTTSEMEEELRVIFDTFCEDWPIEKWPIKHKQLRIDWIPFEDICWDVRESSGKIKTEMSFYDFIYEFDDCFGYNTPTIYIEKNGTLTALCFDYLDYWYFGGFAHRPENDNTDDSDEDDDLDNTENASKRSNSNDKDKKILNAQVENINDETKGKLLTHSDIVEQDGGVLSGELVHNLKSANIERNIRPAADSTRMLHVGERVCRKSSSKENINDETKGKLGSLSDVIEQNGGVLSWELVHKLKSANIKRNIRPAADRIRRLQDGERVHHKSSSEENMNEEIKKKILKVSDIVEQNGGALSWGFVHEMKSAEIEIHIRPAAAGIRMLQLGDRVHYISSSEETILIFNDTDQSTYYVFLNSKIEIDKKSKVHIKIVFMNDDGSFKINENKTVTFETQ
ncbi:unnamed protein product [Bemisia tabaci]|uniref:Uncharacterized protein n=1 Tax=Bemisia tabaci TaxID=7038 RepID=A0A9P0G537_BEMTA|nr:unnamed protein product [Bemisia tabaci]